MKPTPPWLDQQAYPFHSNFMLINGHRLHYIDEGKGETLLFVHGTPSWSFDFRQVIKALSAQYRCVAIDHIGFGLSDKPSEYDYSTQNHAQTLTFFIQNLQLHHITLVVHDFGGPIGFDYASRFPDNIKRLVVLNSWLWNSEDNPDFQKLRKVLRSPLLPLLYKYFNFSPRFLLPQSFGMKKLDKKTQQQYLKPFAKIAERKGPIAFAKSLLNDQSWFENLWQRKQLLQDKPLLLIWGMADSFVTPFNLQKFKEGFLRANTIELKDCGHFPQEEESKTVAGSIAHFIETAPLFN